MPTPPLPPDLDRIVTICLAETEENRTAIVLFLQNVLKKSEVLVFSDKSHVLSLSASKIIIEFYNQLKSLTQGGAFNRNELIKQIIHAIKTRSPPQTSKHLRGLTYAVNKEGICLKLSLIWLLVSSKSKLEKEASRFHPKSGFYLASSANIRPPLPAVAFTPTVNEQRFQDWLNALEGMGLLPDLATVLAEPFYKWSCESILRDMSVVGIYYTHWNYFVQKVLQIIKAMVEKKLPKLAILIASIDLEHAVALTVKIRADHFSIVFFEPDTSQGERKIVLSVQSDLQSKINEMLSSTKIGQQMVSGMDCTFFCLKPESDPHHSRVSPQKLQDDADSGFISKLSFKDKKKYILNIIEVGGDSVFYTTRIKEILDSIFTSDKLLDREQKKNLAIQLNVPISPAGSFIYETIISGYSNIIRIFGEYFPPEVLNASFLGVTPAYAAVERGHINVFLALSEYLSLQELNKPCANGSTPVESLRRRGQIDIYDEIIRKKLQFKDTP